MKNITTVLSLLCIFFTNAQTLDTDVSNLQDILQTVETGKHTFRQDLSLTTDGLLKYILHQEDAKGRGKEIIYHFNFSDIDINTVRDITKKDLIQVQLLIGSKQKLVQITSDGGNKISYTNQFHFYAKDSNNANAIVAAIKALIPDAITLENKRLSLKTYQDHLNWLLENVDAVELPKKQIVQKLETGTQFKGHLTLKQSINIKSNSTSKLYTLNLATLNPNSVNYKISGDELTISVETRRNIKGIKYLENEKQKNYTHQLKIYATSITNGKDIFKVLKAIIPLAEEAFNTNRPNITSVANAVLFLNNACKEVTTSEETLTQSIIIDANVITFTVTETHPDKSNDYQYLFNFADISENNIDYGGNKDRLFVALPAKKSAKFIKNSKNGEAQNYTQKTTMFFNTIEEAIIAKEACRFLVKEFEKKLDAQTYKYSSVQKSVEDTKKILGKVTIGEDAYDVFLELTDSQANIVKLTTVFANLKKSKETILEFSLNDINPKNINIVVSGKRVWTELNTKHLEKIIKTYVDGAIKPYLFKVVIEAKDIESARRIVNIFKATTAQLN
jgi:hypothetical protein